MTCPLLEVRRLYCNHDVWLTFAAAVQIWLMLVMSVILVLPAILISIYFAGALPMSPYRDTLPLQG